jgi:hypothetical protein
MEQEDGTKIDTFGKDKTGRNLQMTWRPMPEDRAVMDKMLEYYHKQGHKTMTYSGLIRIALYSLATSNKIDI